MNSWRFTFIVGIITISLSVSGQEGHQTSNDNYYNLLHHYPFQEHSSEPIFLGESPMNEATVQVFPDGTIKVYHAPNRYSNEVMSMESKDGGFTWSEAEVIFEDSIIWQYPRRTLIDNKGNIHLLVFQEPDLDVYHTATSDGGKTWKPLQKIANGRIGAIRGLIQTKSGRLIFGYHHHKWDRKPPYGSCYISFVYSDDYGETWEDSESQLVAPVFENYNGNNYGAVEPNLVQLSDDRIWMLCRTQTGWLYQSTSDDNGESWSEAEPSAFHSSNSPADLLKLPDGRIVATWCNTGDTDLKTFGKIYTNREVLHMAISDDDGNSWKGFREVFRIPTRNDQNDMPGGDSGVAYPNTAFTKDGKIILVTGQGEHGGGRAMFRISPEWLYETSQEDDFSNGLEKWSCYSFTKLGLKPGRMLGPELLLDEAAKGGKILHVRKAKSEIMGDGAVWNFPM
ncbi:MAG: exo-alpha-sialidase, partial [Cyclobacteriaceae bacterium]|nr:exo-alpha-sialidase [Cyclobacteriaceae bacterium]